MCTALRPHRCARGRSTEAFEGTRAPLGPRARACPCARRRRRRSPRGPRDARGSRPRTARASPSPRTAPSARRARSVARRAAFGAASARRRMLPLGVPPTLELLAEERGHFERVVRDLEALTLLFALCALCDGHLLRHDRAPTAPVPCRAEARRDHR